MTCDKLPPHDEGAEEALLGCIIADPQTAGPIIRRTQGDEMVFFNLDNRSLYSALVRLHNAGKHIDAVTVRAESHDVRGLDFIDGLADKCAPGKWEEYATIVIKRWAQRRSLQTAIEISGAVDNPRHLAAVLKAGHHALRNCASALADPDAEVEKRRFNPLLVPAPIAPVYTLAGAPICTPKNISSIVAQAKTGKSEFIGAMIAAPMREDAGRDCLGVESMNPAGRMLLHFDTEQSPEDHWRMIDRVRRRAGLESIPEWLDSYTLAGLSPNKALAFVLDRLEAFSAGDIHSAFIDGVADLAVDVNDSAESVELVTQLHDTAIRLDCPIIGVIHQNPGSAKTRGHLGSHLERKSETNLQLDKEGEITTVWSEKQRRQPILKANGPRFRWDTAAGMHVSIAPARQESDTKERERAIMVRDDVFGERPAMRWLELVSTLKTRLRVSDATAQRRFEEWRDLGIIKSTIKGLWETVS